jgi:type IV secretory pathway VirB10-like protein
VDDKRKLVPSTLQDPGFKSVNPGVRIALACGAALILALGLWAWLLARPAVSSVVPAVTAAHSAVPAVDVDSTDSGLPATPLPTIVHASLVSRVVAQHVPLLAATPRAAKSVAVAPAPPVVVDPPAVVPRVLTSAEISSSRMNLETPEAPAAKGTTAQAASPPAQTPSGPHSSFFAGSDSVGYESEDAPCIVRATSTIAARLVTHVDSELPGGVVKAQVITPVDCADGDQAIPAGAILQGTYDSGTVAGESRLLVVFTRVIFPPSPGHPNGRAYAMATQSATDALGGTGLSGNVNTHAGRVFGQALLYTLLGAAGEAIGRSTSAGSVVLGGGGGSVTGQFTGGAQAVKPTIYANAGDPVNVVLACDLPMEPMR